MVEAEEIRWWTAAIILETESLVTVKVGDFERD